MILFLKKFKNKQYNINVDIQGIEPVDLDYKDRYGQYSSAPLLQNKKQSQELLQNSSFSSFLNSVPEITKEYPLIIKHQFPRWLRENFDKEAAPSALIKLIQYYYEWLTNIPETLNGIDVFYLDKNYDVDRTNSQFLKHLSYSYINSFPKEQIIQNDSGGFVTQDALRNFISNIKINLYEIKATAKSFLYVISSLLEIDAKKIKITYPKEYVLRLNGGRFPWMSPYGEKGRGEYSTTENYYPSLGGSILNRSIIHDNYFWQDYSYLLDTINEDNAIKYEQVAVPLVHPAGMRYFFETGASFFQNITQVDQQTVYEIPIISNYGLYSILDNSSLEPCFGCAAEGTQPTYKFPSWSKEISTKITNGRYPLGVTFGSIYIGDFLQLTVPTGQAYPNDEIATCDKAGC